MTKIINTLPQMLFKGQTRRFGEKLKNVAGDPMPSNSVYGGLLHGTGDFSIIYGSIDEKTQEPIDKHPVYTDTVSMYIFREYADGKKAFTGDICEVTAFCKKHICLLEFDKDAGTIDFKYYEKGDYHYIHLYDICDFGSDVLYLGDIFDNPEAVERLGFPEETFVLCMCADKHEYECGCPSLTIELDTLDDCIKEAKKLNKDNGDYYCAYVVDIVGKNPWKKFYKEGRES